MKDILSRAAFGLLMAQLVPGGLLLLSAFMVVTVARHGGASSLTSLGDYCLGVAFSSPAASLVSVVAAFSLGMLIHGVNWAVIAFHEHFEDTVFRTWWHRRPLYQQVLLSQLQIPAECLSLLFRATRIKHAALEENVVRLPEGKFENFRFVQDFYLNFGQFYAHASYALAGSAACQLALIGALGPTRWRLSLWVLTHALSATFFVLGRIQFNSLFQAEQGLLPEADESDREHVLPAKSKRRPVDLGAAGASLILAIILGGVALAAPTEHALILFIDRELLGALSLALGVVGLRFLMPPAGTPA